MPGEEAFSISTATTFTRLWRPNFTDLGNAFLDRDENGQFDAGEQSVPYGSGSSGLRESFVDIRCAEC